MKFYHYYDKDHEASVKEHGIISPYYALNKLKDIQMADSMLAKYKDRFEPTPNRQAIIQSLRKFRKDKYGDRYIYALRHPIPKGKSPYLDRFLENKNVMEIEAEPTEDKEYYERVTPEEYWKPDIESKILFKDIKHPGLLFPEGRYKK